MTNKEKRTVAVLFGGRSVEHEVSIITAQQILAALPREKYDAIPIYINKQGDWYTGKHLTNVATFTDLPRALAKAMPITLDLSQKPAVLVSRKRLFLGKPLWQRQIHVALPAGHGAFMEDGCLQGLLELAGIPYVGPGLLSAALGLDKIALKAVLKEAGLPVLPYYGFSSGEWRADRQGVMAEIQQELGVDEPLVVKPADLGSSIGIEVALGRQELADRIPKAFAYSRRVLVEPWLSPCRDLTCAVLGNGESQTCSAFEEPLRAAEILSFEDKYLAAAKTNGRNRLPAELDKAQEQQLTRYALKAFRAVDGRGVCRIDFLLDEKNKAYINEVNTIPGALAFYLFEPQGLAFSALLATLIDLGLQAGEEAKGLLRVYDSNILAAGRGKGETGPGA